MKLGNLARNKLTISIVASAVIAAGYFYWQKARRPTLDQQYQTQVVERGDLTQSMSANGTLNPVVLVNVGTQVSGTVKKLYVDYNDKVKKGQVLMELDDALFAAQARQSEASVRNAEATLELAVTNEKRMRDLFQKEYSSQQELDQAVQNLKVAQAQLALARAQHQKDLTNLQYTVIRSPVAGVVVSREVDIGQTVAASFQTPTLFKIAQDLREMQINSNFAEADIGNIKVDQVAHFTVDAFPNRTFKGRVKQIRLNPTTQQNVVTYNVVVAVENPSEILMPGMTAYVNAVVAERSNVLLVPNAALRYRLPEVAGKAEPKRERPKKRDGAATVYVLNATATGPRPVIIAPGISDNKQTEVLSGELKVGDRVITGDSRSAGNDQNRSNFRMRMF